MSVEKAREFVIALNDKNQDVYKAWKAKAEGPKSDAEQLAAAVETAHEHGYDVTGEEIADAMKTMRIAQREKTEKAVEGLQAMDDDSLEKVAGGNIYWEDLTETYELRSLEDGVKKVEGCRYDFTDDDCWREDACEIGMVRYKGCDNVYFKEECYFREYAGECVLGHVKGF